MQPCSQEDRIGRIENSVGEISAQVTQVAENAAIIRTKLEPVFDQVAEHTAILKGENGDPGLVGKVSRIDEMFTDIVTTLRGSQDKPGMVAVVAKIADDMTEWKDGWKWLWRLGAAAILGEVLVRIIDKLIK